MNHPKEGKLFYKPYMTVLLTLAPLFIAITVMLVNLHHIIEGESNRKKELAYQAEEQKIISDLQSRIETAWSIVDHYHSSGLDQEACKQTLDHLRFGENNYIWVEQIINNGNEDRAFLVVHAAENLINRDVTDDIDFNRISKLYLHGEIVEKDSPKAKDIKPTHLTKEFMKTCKQNGGGVVRYYWPKIVNGKAGDVGYLKASYVKYFPQWKWMIGAGAYADHVDRLVQAQRDRIDANARRLWHIIAISFVTVGTIISAISFTGSSLFSQRMSSHEKHLRQTQAKLAHEMEKVKQSEQFLLKAKVELEEINSRLNASESQYRNVVENVDIGISMITPDMRIISANRQMKDWFPEINFSVNPLCYKVFNDCMQDDLCECCPVVQSFRDGQSHDEIIFKNVKNRKLHFQLASTPIKNSEGKVTAVIEILEDITRRIEMETALRDSEKKYRGLHESIMDAIVHVDLDGHIEDCNQAFQTMLGYSMQELKSMSVFEISTEQWQLDGEKVKAQVYEKGYSDLIEKEYIRKDGTTIPVELRIFLLKDEAGRPSSMWSIVHDISERKAVEARAARNEQIVRTLIANLPQKVVLKDRNSRFLYCNEKYAESVGLPIDKIIGKTDYDLYPEDTAERYIQSDQKIIEFGETVELFSRHNDERGEYITRVMKTAVKNEIDKINGILCVFEDFTERIKTEEGLKKANEELAESNRQLQEMQGQVVQNEKMASIGQLAAGIAHEINNPMGFVTSNFSTLTKYIGAITAVLKSYDQLLTTLLSDESYDLQEELQKVVDTKENMQIDYILEDIPELFEDSSDGMERVIEIVRNLRDFSRVDQIEDFAYVNLVKSIRATLVVASNELKYAANVETDFKEIPEVYCNCGQLNQVFLNILVNAAHAIESQNRDEKGNIEVKIHSKDGFTVCEIADDGPGIPEENRSRIFDPFFTTKAVGKGTGLGLNLSYDIIVNKHKGQLLVDSEVGKGTRFIIKIPENLEDLIIPKEETKHELESESLIC